MARKKVRPATGKQNPQSETVDLIRARERQRKTADREAAKARPAVERWAKALTPKVQAK